MQSVTRTALRRPPFQAMDAAGRLSERCAFAVLIGILTWAPFPLGSNRPWSWSLLLLLVAICWLLWAVSLPLQASVTIRLARRLAGPFALMGLVIFWGLVQIAPWVPDAWAHPIWALASGVLGQPIHGTITLDPWDSGTALAKLGAAAMIAWLACVMTQQTERAQSLLNALVLIGAFYALYTLILEFLGLVQFQLFYAGPPVTSGISGPFVSRNNFATYMGLAVLCSAVRLSSFSHRIDSYRGLRSLSLSALQYVSGPGCFFFLALILTFSMAVASGSRGGFLATLVGMIVLLALWSATVPHRLLSCWGIAGIAMLTGLGSLLFLLNGAALQERFVDLIDENGIDRGRALFWASALRMIAASPWRGFGLGTFESAYPLYADRVLPFTVDKAHNDYLELIAGLGIPAASALLGALLWLTLLCVRGVFCRQRNRGFPLLAVAATALVAFHSSFDFSLQIPAIAVTYAAILGLGVAQAFPTRRLS